MTWTERDRSYYFGFACERELDAKESSEVDCLDEDEADQAFLERYCAPDRQTVKGTAARLAGVPLVLARCVLSRLTELLPYGDHATPGWSGAQLPLVAIGKMDASGRVRRPRCGLCVVDSKLYLWSDDDTVKRLAGGTSGWVPWHRAVAGPVLRYATEVGVRPGEPQDVDLSPELEAFLRKLGPEIVASPVAREPVVPRAACVLMAADPDEAADEPGPAVPAEATKKRLDRSSQVGSLQSSQAIDNSSDLPELGECVTQAIQARSMLRVLRCVAIERMRTVLAAFNNRSLDELIMSTGYPLACQPHSTAAGFFYVAAANLANAAGGRPNHEEFATAVVRALQRGGCFATSTPDTLHRALRDQELASLFIALPPPAGGWSALMRSFMNSAAVVAGGGRTNALHASMIGGISDIMCWLMTVYGGSAAVLHSAMTGAAAAPHAAVWAAVAHLRGCRGMGVALSANLLKDSQVPGLLGVYRDPRAIAAVHAGWFAKPDLHVVRFIAKISRGVRLHMHGRRQLLKTALLAMDQPPTGMGTPGHVPGVYAHLPPRPREYRVIADIHAWAGAVGTSALEIERVLYLIGARSVEIQIPEGGTVSVQVPWYLAAEASIDAAISAGVPPMS